MKTINKGAAILTALVLYGISPAYAKGNIEFRIDKSSYVSDMKNSGTISNRIWYFARNIQTTDYKGNTDGFTLVDINYKVHSGLDAVVDNQFSGSGVRVKAGILAASNVGPVNLSCGILADLDGKHSKKHELNIYGDHSLRNFRFNSEIYTGFGNNLRLNSVNARLNLGFRINDSVVFGIFGQGILTREYKGVFQSKAGVFLRIKP